MNRNVESHFSQLPHADIQRSMFNRDSRHCTTFNVGELIPVYWDEVLPGDTFQMSTRKLVRLQTLLTPVFDNAYLDTYWFYVPNRLTWTHWKEFCGENNSSAWVPSTVYSVPKIKPPVGGFDKGTIADHLGIPPGVEFTPGGEEGSYTYDHYPMALPFRAYALICDQFFRDENLSDPLNIPLGDAYQNGSNGSSYVNDVANGGMPFIAAKYHDYFTSCLCQPEKGDPVRIALGNYPGATAPVVTSDSATIQLPSQQTNPVPLQMYTSKYISSSGTFEEGSYMGTVRQNMKVGGNHTDGFTLETSSPFSEGSSGSGVTALVNGAYYWWPANLEVNIPSASIGYIDINSMRLAFSLQRFLERNARGGTRYIELLKSHFGVTSPDARLQRAEYLGGNRISLNVQQVTNTAQSEADFLGDLGAMSVTSDVHEDFIKSFTEHGILMCVCCVRYDHTYAQGLDRAWTRNVFTDFYLPVFANLGEQPVRTSEIYCDGTVPDVFGYQECWAEYRYKQNSVSADMRPQVSGSLASWNFADYYTEAPVLSDSWIREDKSNVDRTLAVTSSVSNQVLMDMFFDCVATRPMPMYSIPGLIDRN